MFYQIINSCDVELWGVSQKDRIAKVLAKAGAFEYVRDIAKIPADEKLLLLDARYLYEANVVSKLISHDQAILLSSCEKAPIGIWAERSKVETILPWFENKLNNQATFSVPRFTAEELTGGYDPRLRKFDLSHVVLISKDSKKRIENYLYDKSYKGITDLVTKWLWPIPARAAVRFSVAKKITPNMVTGFGWLLTFIAGIAFYFGGFVIGLIAAWVMTFLDTVDGKLARVTLQSSKIGHAMDHGLDIIHPPIWYWCWAMGLGVGDISLFGFSISTMDWVWVMLAAYIGGRVFEGLFQLFFNDISIFCWEPIDSFNRLITARRNPCMILLTLSLFIFGELWGFVWLVLWTVLSTLILAVRFIFALKRRMKGPLNSWIESVNPEEKNPPLAVRLFTGYPAQKTIAPLLQVSD